MSVAFFGQHGGDPFGERELAFVYLVAALALVAAGAGRYSFDAAIRRREPRSYARL